MISVDNIMDLFALLTFRLIVKNKTVKNVFCEAPDQDAREKIEKSSEGRKLKLHDRIPWQNDDDRQVHPPNYQRMCFR